MANGGLLPRCCPWARPEESQRDLERLVKELLLAIGETGHGTVQDVDKVRVSLLHCVG